MTPERLASSPVWLLKNIWTCNGHVDRGSAKGIQIITDWATYREEKAKTEQMAQRPDRLGRDSTEIAGPDGRPEPVADRHFLQRGICNPHLIHGKKYILRAYYLTLGDGRVYMYNDCLGYIHAAPFDASSCDWGVHVSSFTVHGSDRDTRTCFTLSDIPEYERIFDYMVQHSKRHSVMWADTARKSLDNPDESLRLDASRYHIWSASYLVMDDLTSHLLSLKAYPNMNHHVTDGNFTKSAPRLHEYPFRRKGFDRDILRILGVDDGGVPADTPRTWVDVTHGGGDEEWTRAVRSTDPA